MALEFYCEVVTPERVVFQGNAVLVVVPGVDGEMGFQALHTPLASLLNPGEVRITFADGNKEHIAISSGYVKMLEDKVTIITESAFLAEEVDVKAAEEQLVDARARMERGDLEPAELLKAKLDVRRAEAHLRVAERRQKR